MYGWIWKKLPGPRFVKVLTSVLLLGIIVIGLFMYGFPLLDQVFVQDPTLR
jgi:hypothetical protein